MVTQPGLEDAFPQLLEFFKALADADRLKIFGVLARVPHAVEQITAILDIRPAEVFRHLARLEEIGLVTVRQEGARQVYEVNVEDLEARSKRLLRREPLSLDIDIGADAFDRKVIRDFAAPGGRLKRLPARRKKLEAILRHLVRAFEPRVRYREREVNEILERFHDDTSSLRRELVDAGLMGRDADGTSYWRIE